MSDDKPKPEDVGQRPGQQQEGYAAGNTYSDRSGIAARAKARNRSSARTNGWHRGDPAASCTAVAAGGCADRAGRVLPGGALTVPPNPQVLG